eukprot:m.198390 g.198390  ORF g.198390 m.198390 type:complete len:65 (-) comp14921_c3_seq2:351-545(-)
MVACCNLDVMNMKVGSMATDAKAVTIEARRSIVLIRVGREAFSDEANHPGFTIGLLMCVKQTET